MEIKLGIFDIPLVKDQTLTDEDGRKVDNIIWFYKNTGLGNVKGMHVFDTIMEALNYH